MLLETCVILNCYLIVNLIKDLYNLIVNLSIKFDRLIPYFPSTKVGAKHVLDWPTFGGNPSIIN